MYKKNDSTYYILCSVSKAPCYCSGNRLKKLIEKHGTCEKVAATYVSRDAKRLIKNKVPAKAVMKMDKGTLREEATAVQRDRAARREERRRRREAKEAIRSNPNNIIYNPAPAMHHDLTVPGVIAKMTKDACLFPNRFLDHDRTCNACTLRIHCTCSVKNVIEEATTKRKKVVAAA